MRRRLTGRSGMWKAGGVPLNTALSGARTIVRALMAFALLPLLIDQIGTAPTGLFVFATTLTGYFTAVQLGLGTSVTKYVAEFRATAEHGQLNSVLRGSLLLMTGLGVLVAIGLGSFALLGGRSLFDGAAIRDQAVPALLVAAGTSLLYWPSRLGTAALEGLERYDISAAIQIVSAGVTLLGLYLTMQVTHSVAVLVAVFNAAMIVEGLIGGAVAWPHLGLRRGEGRWLGDTLRPVVGFGGALFVIGMTDTFVYSLDRTILAGLVGASAIVYYEVGLRPHTGVRSIAQLVGGALISTSSRLFAQNRGDRLRELVLFGSLLGVLLTTPMAVLVIVFAKPFVNAWLGPEYVHYAVYAQIFTSYWLVHSNTGVLGSAVTGIGDMRLFMWLSVIGGVITLALSLALTLAWGTVGVIWGTVIPAWLGLPVWMHFALRRTGVSKRSYLKQVIAPGYGVVVPWAALVWLAGELRQPQGFPELVAYSAVALLLLAAVAAPLVRSRWPSPGGAAELSPLPS